MKHFMPFLLFPLAISSAEAHDPKLHKKSEEAPNCAYLESMDKANSDTLVLKALEQKCYSELHQDEHNMKRDAMPMGDHKHSDGHQHGSHMEGGHMNGKHHHSDLAE